MIEKEREVADDGRIIDNDRGGEDERSNNSQSWKG